MRGDAEAHEMVAPGSLATVLALLANTAPVAFGSIGIPVVTLGALVAPILHKDVTAHLKVMIEKEAAE